MGEDIDAPHSCSFRISANAILNDALSHLASRHYLASEAGRDHSWKVIIDKKPVALIKGNNRLQEPSDMLSQRLSNYVNNGTINVRFIYNGETYKERGQHRLTGSIGLYMRLLCDKSVIKRGAQK